MLDPSRLQVTGASRFHLPSLGAGLGSPESQWTEMATFQTAKIIPRFCHSRSLYLVFSAEKMLITFFLSPLPLCSVF